MSKELIESLRAGIVFYYKTSRINFIETERIMKEAASKIENLEREKEDIANALLAEKKRLQSDI